MVTTLLATHVATVTLRFEVLCRSMYQYFNIPKGHSQHNKKKLKVRFSGKFTSGILKNNMEQFKQLAY